LIGRFVNEEQKEKTRQRARLWAKNNPERKRAHDARRRKENAEEISAYHKVWRAKNKERCKEHSRVKNIKNRFNLSADEYDEKLRMQGGLCALCKTPFYGNNKLGRGAPVLDHSHLTGGIREFVHRECNTGLGYFKDSLDVLKLSVEYLEKHKGV
jgi:hypothetical protein